MHISIWKADLRHMKECNTCCQRLFHCPLCPTFKPSKKANIQRHVGAHAKNAVHFKDKYICRCRLPCRTEAHYHCPLCEKTHILQYFKRHYKDFTFNVCVWMKQMAYLKFEEVVINIRLFTFQGKSIYIVDLYVTPTWLPPSNCDPVISLPSDAQWKDALLFPLWTPGHFQLCGFPTQDFGCDCGIFMLMFDVPPLYENGGASF
ncbi:uncharacterized protein LOC118221552 isoform X2 [Anguilla anguilla]|uniref:uncharacterized protein LOC118221552 isoform X2 n=1 Tax=Anguilla anguilla TaxID=7936 RepID=UPI0015AC2E11|nr:uncharacterized protein LOC118221552 isoform X2 [Anguilla anguilla]